ncbi:Aspartyl protease [Mesonia phycicola]|uniref:Aspartyl protease n=1 Tax=Mesonia phycicola TaxID=579105 RepID=A0A1M6FM51_9FLAO|nr:retropepsin-like aspartic protease [Mesonia phycicola]SHI98755.1 Aspartyl protease [Mesonia phycicola]
MKNLLFTIFFTSFVVFSQERKEPVIIPFQLTPNGHILINAKVNGVEGKFIFDTGAGMNLLIKKFADKISDLEKTHHFHTGHRATGEEIMSDIWNSKLIEISDFKFKKDVCAVYDLDFPIDGLISLTPFVNTPLTIDFKKKQLVVETAESVNKRVAAADFEMPIKVHYDKGITVAIATNVTLNDQLSLLVNLDSGAGSGVFRFNARYLESLAIDTLSTEVQVRASMFKPEHSNKFYFTKLNKLSTAKNQTEINNVKAQFITGLIHEGIMGIDWIGEIITIDLQGQRLVVQK